MGDVRDRGLNTIISTTRFAGLGIVHTTEKTTLFARVNSEYRRYHRLIAKIPHPLLFIQFTIQTAGGSPVLLPTMSNGKTRMPNIVESYNIYKPDPHVFDELFNTGFSKEESGFYLESLDDATGYIDPDNMVPTIAIENSIPPKRAQSFPAIVRTPDNLYSIPLGMIKERIAVYEKVMLILVDETVLPLIKAREVKVGRININPPEVLAQEASSTA